jgi:hypothetical protein
MWFFSLICETMRFRKVQRLLRYILAYIRDLHYAHAISPTTIMTEL